MKKLVNTRQAAEILGLKHNTLEIWRCRNQGPKYIRLGRRVLYDLEELEDFAAACTVETHYGAMARNFELSDRRKRA